MKLFYRASNLVIVLGGLPEKLPHFFVRRLGVRIAVESRQMRQLRSLEHTIKGDHAEGFRALGCWWRLSDALDRNGEHISDTTLSLDDSRRAGVAFELTSKAKNLHVDAAIEDILVHSRGLQEVLAAEWALRRIEKGKQQCVLALGQGYWSAVWVRELPCLLVELPAGKSKATALGIARRSGASYLEPS